MTTQQADDGAPAHTSARALGRAGAVLLVVALGAKLLGFGRDAYLAGLFGASRQTDGFFLIFALWVQVAITLAGSSVQAFVPRWLAVRRSQGDPAAMAFFGTTLAVFAVVGVGVALAVSGAAAPLVGLLAPEFDAATRSTTARLLRLCAPVLPLCAVAGVLSAFSHARGHYLLVKSTSVGMNVGILATLLIGGRALGIDAAAIGCTVGAALMLAGCVLYLVRERALPTLAGGHGRAALLVLGGVCSLSLIGHSGGYLMQIATRSAFAALPEGFLTRVAYAWRVVGTPAQLLQFALLSTLIAALAARVASGRGDDAARFARRVLNIVVCVLLPALGLTVALRRPLVRLLFERGAFTAEDTEVTALLLAALAPAILCTVIRNVVATTWYAHGRVWVTNGVGLLGIAVFVIGAPHAVAAGGAVGLCLLQGLASAATLGVLLVASPRIAGIRWGASAGRAGRIALTTVPALAFAAGMEYLGARVLTEGTASAALVLFGGGAGALGLFVATGLLTGLDELAQVRRVLRRGVLD